MNHDVLITVLSWEDRFILGLEKNIIEFKPKKVLLFKYNNPLTSQWKLDNLQKTRDLVGDALEIIVIDGSLPTENWFIFKDTFFKYCFKKNVLVDITTMTRESIWLALYNCKINECKTDYIYYKPEPNGYSPDWISRDPGKPRLLYKMSGIAKLGAPTLLLVTGGYDIQRLDSLIYNFEPKKTILFFQDGEDPRNNENFLSCQELFRSKYKIEMIYEYDAYNVELSFNLILEKLLQKNNDNARTYLDRYNIILNSLGSKISAITLFNFWLKYPQVALSYIPSKEYNKEYSKGIGQSYFGSVLV
jgi:hypothetical protein